MEKSIIIIGGGASGLTCAIKAKTLYPNSQITILEKNDRIGKKILKTGNGRCNISNTNMDPSFFNNEKFLKQCLSEINVEDVITFFKEIGLFIKNDENSTRLYPYSETATSVVDSFRYEISRLGIEVKVNSEVVDVYKDNDKFYIVTNFELLTCDILVFASGSIAQEKTNGYDLLKKFKHNITSLNPGLVPLKTKEKLKSIQGLRIKCRASIYNNGILSHQEDGEILFKDQGLSGVLSLNLSRYVKEISHICFDLFPNRPLLKEELIGVLKHKSFNEVLLGILPKMLAFEIMKRLSSKDIDSLITLLKNLRFDISGKYDYDIAQITLGGVKVEEINDDFSSKLVKNLFIIGEILDIDGASGGYNLHFAWISGIIAAMSFEKK